MKIALLSDTHWGVRNDHPAFLDNTKLFLDNVFFPYIDSNNIEGIIHPGDLTDRRKYININTARRLREDFFNPLEARNLFFDIIAGNHDTYYKNTNKINSLSELIQNPKHRVFWEASEQLYDGLPILLLPWICDDNRAQSLDVVRNSNAPICMAHLELDGYEMYKGVVNIGGDDPSLFGHFDAVYSGHYHHRSSRRNIHYVGSHGQFTWSDYDDIRGFHILDTQTKEVTFVENPYTMFEKVWYDDRDKTVDDILEQDFSRFNNKMVKVVVTAKSNPYWFDKFIDEIEKQSVIDMQVVEDHRNLDLQNDETIIDEAQSTIEIFRSYIESASIPGTNKLKLEKTIEELYAEALSIE
ncbi:MAG: metallophosphoesterase [Candidatus Bathyarchaeia archaeon]